MCETQLRYSPLQTLNKTFARTIEFTSTHVLVLHVLTRTPSHTLSRIQNKIFYKTNSFTKQIDKNKRLKKLQ